MDKQETLYLPVKKEGFIFSTDDSECKRYYRTLDGEEVSSSFKAKSKEELLDQLKPVVPKFVAEWIEVNEKKEFYARLDNLIFDSYVHQLGTDMTSFIYGRTEKIKELIFAYEFGYEVEQEKLYTVKVLDSTLFKMTSDNHVRYKLIGENAIPSESKIGNYTFEANLTEQEIKGAAERLWQFAKEIE